jgi:Deoxyribonuclease NucA/NucB
MRLRHSKRVNSYGPANGLNKTFTYSSRLSRIALAPPEREKRSDALPTLRFQPVITCGSTADSSAQCQLNVPAVSVTALSGIPSDPNSGWSSPSTGQLNLSWGGGDGTYTEFGFGNQVLYFAKPGYSIDLNDTYYALESLAFSPLRCDKKLSSQTTTNGCVYPAAPAVLVLSATDPAVKEAAEHIREAQQGSLRAPGGLDIDPGTNVATASTGNALQRTRIVGANESNRDASCQGSQSLFVTRPAPVSATCQANQAGCQCDEYPFAATWNGGFFAPNSTSVKRIQGPQNQRAGSNLSGFYQKERVLDLTVYDGSPTATTYDLSQEKSRGGDNFWVHIE